jgi:hypothetical protein
MASDLKCTECNPSSAMKCLMCVSEYLVLSEDEKIRIQADDQFDAVVQDAVTLAPSWQEHSIGGQPLVACIAVPACMGHLGIKKDSIQELASRSGLALPGINN